MYSLTASHIETIQEENNGIYLLKINTKQKIIDIDEYSENNFKSAKTAYLNEEKKNSKKTYMTISLVSTDHFDTLKKAYPNYFADSEKFTNNLKKILSITKDIKPTKEKPNWLMKLILTHRKPEQQ